MNQYMLDLVSTVLFQLRLV